MRSGSPCLLGLAAGLSLLTAACSYRPPPVDQDLDISGELYQGDARVRVVINGEQVADGYLPMTEAENAMSQGSVFPLRGEYRGAPVEVGCGRQPVVAYPYCEVSLDGRLVAILRFDPLTTKAWG